MDAHGIVGVSRGSLRSRWRTPKWQLIKATIQCGFSVLAQSGFQARTRELCNFCTTLFIFAWQRLSLLLTLDWLLVVVFYCCCSRFLPLSWLMQFTATNCVNCKICKLLKCSVQMLMEIGKMLNILKGEN